MSGGEEDFFAESHTKKPYHRWVMIEGLAKILVLFKIVASQQLSYFMINKIKLPLLNK